MKKNLAIALLALSMAAASAGAATGKPQAKAKAQDLEQLATAAVKENYAAIDAATEAATLDSVQIRTIGHEPWDAMIKETANEAIARGRITIKRSAIISRYKATLAKIGYPKLVYPESLATLHNFAEAIVVIQGAEEAFNILQSEQAEADQEAEKGLRALPLASKPEYKAAIANALADMKSSAQKYDKATRKLLGAQREMVVFMQEHARGINLNGETLEFDDDESLNKFNKLNERIDTAIDEVDAALAPQAPAT